MFTTSGNRSGRKLFNLKFWSETQTTASPNQIINSSVWTPVATTANANGVYGCKGAAGIQAQDSDGTTVGGDVRGPGGTDWQRTRAASTRVASGQNATVGGGNNNEASTVGACVPGGTGNRARGGNNAFAAGNQSDASAAAAIAMGDNCIASSAQSVAMGSSCTASAVAAMSIGNGNTADGLASVALGNNSLTRGLTGNRVFASGNFSSGGDCQVEEPIVRRFTSNATPAVLSMDGGGPSTANTTVLPNNTTMSTPFLQIISSNAADRKVWHCTNIVVHRGAGAGTITLDAGAVPAATFATAGTATWAAAIGVNLVNGSFEVTVTGAAGTNISTQAIAYWGKVTG